MQNDMVSKVILVALAIGGIHLGLVELFQFNIFQQFIPEYAKYVHIGLGAVGGYVLYNTFKK